MPLRGSTKALQQLAKQVRGLGAEKFRRKLMRTMAEECLAQVQLGFQRGRSPDGRRWPISLRAKLQGGQTLLDTGRLRNSIRISYASGYHGFALYTNTRYAAIHNHGGIIKARGRMAGNFRVKLNAKGQSRTSWSNRGSSFLTFKLPNGQWVKVKQVTIPRRQFMPYKGQMPDPWARVLRPLIAGQIAVALGRR